MIAAKARELRTAEYADLRNEIEAFLRHIEREQEHRPFTFLDLEELEEDYTKLRRWFDQVRRRDFVDLQCKEEISELLGQCESRLAMPQGQLTGERQ